MPLQLSFTDQYGNTADYIEIYDYRQIHGEQEGYFEMRMWKDDTAKLSGYSQVDICLIPLRGDNKIDGDGCVVEAKFTQFDDQTLVQLYTKAKTQKVKTQSGIILDLTTAIDYP